MGQVPAKYMPPSAPYGGSQASSVLNQTQGAAVSPQTPLLPPNFTDPGRMAQGTASFNPQAPKKPTQFPDIGPLKGFFGL